MCVCSTNNEGMVIKLKRKKSFADRNINENLKFYADSTIFSFLA